VSSLPKKASCDKVPDADAEEDVTFAGKGDHVQSPTSILALNYHPPLEGMSKFCLHLCFTDTDCYYVDHSCHILSDSTWTSWSDVKSNQNVPIIIGSHILRSKGEGTFTESNHFCDVFAALRLMLNLMLEPFSVQSEKSCITNSLMKLIKESSAPNIAGRTSSNSFVKVNKKFCRFVIDMLSVQLVFNNWYPFASQSAPSPYVKETPGDVTRHILHNQKVLLLLCFKMNPTSSMDMFRDEKMNRLGWQVSSLKTIFSSAVTMKHKVEKGIISSWENYA
jgi:hypothetical protein